MKDIADNKTIDAFEKKPLSGAERQAALRERRKSEARINEYISIEHKKMLDEKRGNKTIREFLEMIIEKYSTN